MTRRPKPAADPTKAVAYLRASTERQDLSPDAQRAAIEAWAKGAEVAVVAWHQDLGVSGGAPLEDRPGLTAAVADLAVHGAGVLVVARRDRLARDVLNAALIERLVERDGGRIMSADGCANGDGPEAALLRAVVNAFSAYERALIRARTRAALQVKKSRGERTGGVPYGWRAGGDGRLEPVPREQAATARARALRGEGLSLRQIATTLAAEGHAPRKGGAWAVQTVRRLTAEAAGG